MTKLLKSKNSFLFCEGGILNYLKIIVLLFLYFIVQVFPNTKPLHVAIIALLNTSNPCEWIFNFIENVSDDALDVFNLTNLLHIANVKFIVGFAIVAPMIYKVIKKRTDKKECIFWCYCTILFLLSSIFQLVNPSLCISLGFIQIIPEFLGNTNLFKSKTNDECDEKSMQEKEDSVKIALINKDVFTYNKVEVIIQNIIKTKKHIKRIEKPPSRRWFLCYGTKNISST